MSGILSLLGNGSTSNTLGGMLQTGATGSLNAGFGGTQQNAYQRLLGSNTATKMLDKADSMGMLRAGQPQQTNMYPMAAQTPLIYSLRRRY